MNCVKHGSFPEEGSCPVCYGTELVYTFDDEEDTVDEDTPCIDHGRTLREAP